MSVAWRSVAAWSAPRAASASAPEAADAYAGPVGSAPAPPAPVSPGVLKAATQALKRFDLISPDRIELHRFPREPRAIDFLRGESEYDVQDGKLNAVNNPLSLIRPYALHSSSSLCYENNPNQSSPSPYRTERGWGNETAIEAGYMDLVKGFETVHARILESLNLEDPEARRALVRGALNEQFGQKQVSQYLAPTDVRKHAPDQSPESWLVYGVVNVLTHPSPEVSALARLRALDLLSLATPEALETGFRSKKQQYHNGYDRVSPPRLPERIATREERLAPDQKNWSQNPFMQNLLVRDHNRRLDNRAVTAKLLEESPDLAVSVALLMLHDASSTGAALGFLQSIPVLAPELQDKIMGPSASYLLDRFGKNGVQGLGYELPPASRVDVAVLEQELARKETYAAHLKEELERTQAELAQARAEAQNARNVQAWAQQVQARAGARESRHQTLLAQSLELSLQPPLERTRTLENLLAELALEPSEQAAFEAARDGALAQATGAARDLEELGQATSMARSCSRATALIVIDQALQLVAGPLGGSLGHLREQVADSLVAPEQALQTLTDVGQEMARLKASQAPNQGVQVGDGHVMVGGVRLRQRG